MVKKIEDVFIRFDVIHERMTAKTALPSHRAVKIRRFYVSQPSLWAPAQRKRATMLYFANVFFYFLWPPYSPALVNGGSRKFYTW